MATAQNTILIRHFDRVMWNQPHYRAWFEDPEVTRFTSHNRLNMNFDQFISDVESGKIVCLAFGTSSKHLGNATIQLIDWVNRRAEITFMIGSKESMNKGLGTEMFKAVRDHAFNRLNLERIWLGVPKDNIPMIKIAEKFMIKCGQFTDAFSYEGKVCNVNIYETS